MSQSNTPKVSDITEKWSRLTPAQKKAVDSATSAILADPAALKRVKRSIKRKMTPTPRTPSAYILFAKQKRSQLKQNNPGITFQDMGRQLGKLWEQASEQEKAEYGKKAATASPFKKKAKKAAKSSSKKKTAKKTSAKKAK